MLDIKRQFLEKMRDYGHQGLKDSLAEDDAPIDEAGALGGLEGQIEGEELAGADPGLEDPGAFAGAKRSQGSGSIEDLGGLDGGTGGWRSPKPPREFPEMDEPGEADIYPAVENTSEEELQRLIEEILRKQEGV